ncbi:hypothetical protein QQZ08_009319 [Neonectria magnoliae]|uniref:Uncharacterized protein n=1 Tax=Neonectria magnoliae TaxID=2732573 RepID=A0ABR1HPR8_9HYPO
MFYEAMKTYLDGLKQHHSGRRSSRWFTKLGPLMGHLRAFSGVIGLRFSQNRLGRRFIFLRLQEVYEACRSDEAPIQGGLAFAELLASAGNYLYEHKYDEAEAYFVRSPLSLKDELGRLCHIPEFEYAESKNNLACVQLGHEATDLVDKVDGHANYTPFFFFLGVCYYWAGQFQKALKILQRTYQIRVTTFGKSSYNARHSAFAIVMVLYRLGRLEEARKAVMNCFGRQGNGIWPEKCLIRAQYMRSMIPRSLDDFDKAIELENEARMQLRRLLPVSWPELLGVGPDTSLDSVDHSILCDLIIPNPAGHFMTYN